MKSRKGSLSKTALLLTIILCVAFVFGSTHQSLAAPLCVDEDGACDTCPPLDCEAAGFSAYTSVEGAMTDASSGDTVYVCPGTYDEGITMEDGVNVVGDIAVPTTTSITGSSGDPGRAAVVVFSSASGGAWITGATLSGFEIGYSGGGAGAGVFVEGSATDVVDATIDNCLIQGNPGPGVRLDGKVTATIEDCTIIDNKKAGIVTGEGSVSDLLASDSSVTISNNTIGGASGDGNKFGGIILNGHASATGIAVLIDQSNDISYNTKGSGNGKGGAGIRLWQIDSANITNNTISDNDRGGIVLIDVAGGQIQGNTIFAHDTEAGINIGGASDVTIGPNNDIYSNHAGIAFYAELNTTLDASMRNPSSGTVTIGTGADLASRNDIYQNTKAGIAVIDPLTSGQINIDFNHIYQNTQAAIAFFNECTASITDNEIYDNTGAAGIFTGDWSGILPPDGSGFYTTVPAMPASLTITRNKVYSNRSGMRLDHASGTVTNNLVYGNDKAGIRFSGGNAADSPLGVNWGITNITNNTVADNGVSGIGGGIVYDDISDTTSRQFTDDPPQGSAWDWTYLQDNLFIENNISANNATAGIRVGCDESHLDNIHYNLLYGNYGFGECIATEPIACVLQQLGGYCWDTGTDSPPTGVIFDDPLFSNLAGDEYRLCEGLDDPDDSCTEGSPAVGAGFGGVNMGCDGDPITFP